MRTPTSAIPWLFPPFERSSWHLCSQKETKAEKHANRSMPSKPLTAAVYPGLDDDGLHAPLPVRGSDAQLCRL